MSRLMAPLLLLASAAPALALPSCAAGSPGCEPGDDLVSAMQLPRKAKEESGLPLKVCHEAPYTLCSVAMCTVMNSLAVCNCTYMGVNASITLNYQASENAQWTNKESADVCGYMWDLTKVGKVLSTYSGYSLDNIFNFPNSVDQVSTDVCVGSSTVTAQCDGGVCEVMDQETGKPKTDYSTWKAGDLSVCSCPIFTGIPLQTIVGTSTLDPTTGKCKKTNPLCGKPDTTGFLGTYSVKVGAPPGTSDVLNEILYKTTGYPPVLPSYQRCIVA